MTRQLIGGLLVAGCALAAFAKSVPVQDPRSLPMNFELRREGPAEACGTKCRTWISAVGSITSDTPSIFETFIQSHDLRGATLALDSGGGSVLATMEMGRQIRRLAMVTTVGRTIALSGVDDGERRARLSPRADCESMCAFLLLAGAQRQVPSAARVMVHQIWLGDKRDDPTAVTYTAEDIALIQRDIGRLVQFTAEMGGSPDLIEIALRIPPWERMRALTGEELRRTKLSTVEQIIDQPKQPEPVISLAPSSRVISVAAAPTEQGWAMIETEGRATLLRRHPLTIEGDEIGSFDLAIACADHGEGYTVTYQERRKSGIAQHAPGALREVALLIGRESAALKIVSSTARAPELDSIARAIVPANFLKVFAQAAARSLTVETTASDNVETAIRIGNTGVAENFAKLSAACGTTASASAAHP